MSTPSPSLGAMPLRRFCDEYGVGLTFTYAEINAGRLKAVKAGRSTLIRRADAEAWLNKLQSLQDAKRARESGQPQHGA